MLVVKKFTDTTHDIQNTISEYKTHITSVELLIDSLKNIHTCLIFFDLSGTIVGTVSVNIDTTVLTFNTNYWICNLFVLPEYRKKGYGKYILDYTENYLNKQGISIAHLYCNEDLLDFYKRNAWNVSDDNVPDRPLSKIMIKML